jgi:hypothetical protein
MTIDTIMEKAATDLLAIGGKTATYTPVSGDPVDCLVLVYHDVLVQADGYEVGVATLGTTVTAKVSDVGTINRRDTFLVGETTYTVQRIETNDNVMVTAVVK